MLEGESRAVVRVYGLGRGRLLIVVRQESWAVNRRWSQASRISLAVSLLKGWVERIASYLERKRGGEAWSPTE